jgi:hypothetical protein
MTELASSVGCPGVFGPFPQPVSMNHRIVPSGPGESQRPGCLIRYNVLTY